MKRVRRAAWGSLQLNEDPQPSSKPAISSTRAALQDPTRGYTTFGCASSSPSQTGSPSATGRTSLRRHTCTVCGKAFIRSGHLTRHFLTHTGERPYVCHFCGKAFRENNLLRQHIHTHTGERPYSCGTMFSMNRVRGAAWGGMLLSEGPKPATTPAVSSARAALQDSARGNTTAVCASSSPSQTGSSSATGRTSLRRHTCTVCGKAFIRSDHLTCHFRMHTGERPYVCRFCQKTFRQSNHLLQHIYTHTGQKPFSCSQCGLSYSAKSGLAHHNRKYHSVSSLK